MLFEKMSLLKKWFVWIGLKLRVEERREVEIRYMKTKI